MTFHAFLQTKYPLYSDTEIKVNLTVQQLCELVEEFIMIEIDDLTSEDLARLDEGLKDIAQGKTTSWDDVKKDNGITDTISKEIIGDFETIVWVHKNGFTMAYGKKNLGGAIVSAATRSECEEKYIQAMAYYKIYTDMYNMMTDEQKAEYNQKIQEQIDKQKI